MRPEPKTLPKPHPRGPKTMPVSHPNIPLFPQKTSPPFKTNLKSKNGKRTSCTVSWQANKNKDCKNSKQKKQSKQSARSAVNEAGKWVQNEGTGAQQAASRAISISRRAKAQCSTAKQTKQRNTRGAGNEICGSNSPSKPVEIATMGFQLTKTEDFQEGVSNETEASPVAKRVPQKTKMIRSQEPEHEDKQEREQEQ